jgi:hypothetical protein
MESSPGSKRKRAAGTLAALLGGSSQRAAKDLELKELNPIFHTVIRSKLGY